MKPRVARAIADVREVGWLHGYAVALHGTVRRDLDLVAVPWIACAAAPLVLIEAVVADLDALVTNPARDNEMPQSWFGRREPSYIDLSVFPPAPL